MKREWRTSIVTYPYKRGAKEKTEYNKGISLLCSIYKIYAEKYKRIKELNGKRKIAANRV